MMVISNFALFLPLFHLSAVSLHNMTSMAPNVSSSSVPFGTELYTSVVTPASTDDNKPMGQHHTALLAIYSVVLFSGTISLSLMMYMMKSNMTSSTSIAVLNLIFTHFIFLLTVPFRIYYHATTCWNLGHGWCRAISGMIHIHMYMSFIFYVIILSMRLVMFYCRSGRKVSINRVHALFVSIVVWLVVLVVFPCIMFLYYGNDPEHSKSHNNTHCFDFGKHIKSRGKVFNYIVSIAIIVVSSLLTALQANATWVLYRKHQESCTFQQEFAAHLKSLYFAAIMAVCFIPYHIFRLTYLENLDLQNVNEVFLSLTTLNCVDMLTFLGNRRCIMCLLGKKI